MKNLNDIEAIIKEYINPVYNFVFRLCGSAEEADDITQDVFIKVWKNLKKFNPEKNFKTWIFTIARNTTFDWLRKRKNISFSQVDSLINSGIENDDKKEFKEGIVDIGPLPDEIFVNRELAKELENALSKIRPDFREIILLHYTEGLTFEEISKIVGKPLNTVKSQYRRALHQIRTFIRI